MPIVADVLLPRHQGLRLPSTRHAGEEWNYVVSGTLAFHTDIYAPVILRGRRQYLFRRAEMGHAHVRLGDKACSLIAMIVPREARSVENGVAPAMEIVRGRRPGRTREEAVREPFRLAFFSRKFSYWENSWWGNAACLA